MDTETPIDLGETVYHWDAGGRLRRGVVREIHATQDGTKLAVDFGSLSFTSGERLVAPVAEFTRNPFPKD